MVWRVVSGLIVPTLAVVTALVLGGVVIWLTSGGFGAPGEATQKTLAAYQGLLDGAFFNERSFSETIVATTPYILAGLSVAFAFKGGLFNIGAEGQYFLGAVSAAWVGYALPLPPVLHLLVALAAGFIGGGLWGAIPGYLKARTGAHEVIVTIMLNYIAFLLVDWLVNSPLRAPRSSAPKTPDILDTAMLPRFFPAPDRLHSGILVALFAVVIIWWFLNKTTLGFEIRTVGANRDAARYAGMNVTRIFVMAMGIAGGLAGLAGGVEVLGLQHNLPAFFSAGYGFDSIAIALLARTNPLGIVPAAFLFGALRNGADLMELRSGASKQIISVVQAMMLLFVAAPAIIRALYRLRAPKDAVKEAPLSRGWGG
ncbi:MAG: ABC transporter permease [Anaerolineae bacterium]|nr:ABC transporter permease [Anaerolineae bacterium]